MLGLLLLTAVVAFSLEVHPCAVSWRAQSPRDAGTAAGLLGRAGPVLAVMGLVVVVTGLSLAVGENVRTARGVRIAALLLATVALGCAGWHRIATTARLDLRREAEREETETAGVLADVRGELRRPAWHLFWWAVAPGLVLALVPISAVGPVLACVVYAAVVGGWSLLLDRRARRRPARVIRTGPFRLLHSLGGLALLFSAGLALVESLSRAGLAPFLTERILRPLLGAGT